MIDTRAVRKFARENLLTARHVGVLDLIVEYDRSKRDNAALVKAAKKAIGILVITQNDLAAAGNGGSNDDRICEEAQYLTPAIRALRNAIRKSGTP